MDDEQQKVYQPDLPRRNGVQAGGSTTSDDDGFDPRAAIARVREMRYIIEYDGSVPLETLPAEAAARQETRQSAFPGGRR